MAATSARGLTKLSFRRDVRLFLGALVGFLAVLVVLLLLLLQSFLSHTRDAVRQRWENAARLAVADFSRGSDVSAADLQLTVIRSRYGIAGATLTTRDGREITSGVRAANDEVEALVRPTPVGTLTLFFDNSRLVASRRTFQLTALVSVLAVACGVTLLALYLPRITGPIEQMLDSAAEISERGPDVDEQDYLIETFRASIDTLKMQQNELQRLHDAQKVRADDLERVTAALTRSLTSGFLAVDPRGRVVDLNLAAREILHAGDVAGAPLDDAFGENAFTRSVLDAVENREAMTRSEVTFARDGSPPQLIGLTTVPLLDANQQFLGLLA
ncbi:MAG TPA: hypothetical protein VHL59_12715, partial [Thermoanaerobaculia bacterium]|nr:hypothetical protein [Thermoanaerobaculia bacterium]